MTAAVWMALPPEVHSALLSQGPGPGPLAAAAAAWRALSVEYAVAADEISTLTAATQQAWEGAGASSWTAAHQPFAAWLLQASADSAAAACRHEIAEAAYSAALAAMPTLSELAANHALHAALVTTNFFGINAIPIALNEADYVRMWIQAATTMSVYETSATAAVASAPSPVPAPQIVRSAAPAQAQPAASLDPVRIALKALEPILNEFGINPLIRNPLVSNVVTTFIADVLENFGVYWDPAAGMLNGLDYEYYADATQPMWYLARGLELIGDSMQMSQNPAQAVQYMLALAIFDWPTHIAQLGTAITQSPLLLAAAGGAVVVPAASAGGLAGLAGLAAPPQPMAAPEPLTGADEPSSWHLAGSSSAPTGVATAPTSTPAPAPAPTSAPAPISSLPTTSPGPAAGFAPPYAVGPPGIGFGSGMAAGASASVRKKAAEPDRAPAAAQSRAAERRKARARQRSRTIQRQPGDEYLDMDGDVEPDWDEPLGTPDSTASDRGAQRLGLAGTLSQDTVTQAAGLTRLHDGQFDDGPTLPMLPNTWR
ncbi:PPE family protein [Mycobacterium sp. TY815]|uniref:PPE family protein n=1 Tax=Mycobacterium sp. TY815 TaxID=3050581 RepID=UPI00274043BA|nr:PPE family protein [Mycobacterium sp. TY815]MDP7701573.1 PPE family protein [Mycobacterium sp. TY815]